MTVDSNVALTNRVVELGLTTPLAYPLAEPGQFVRVDCNDILPRPFCVAWQEERKIGLIIEVKGPGTRWLAGRRTGEQIDVSPPLGKGFKLDPAGTGYLLVGGGLGVAPLYAVLSQLHQQTFIDSLLGFKTKDEILLERRFADRSRLILTTDDGSYGTPGRVDEALAKHLSNNFDTILACGPRPMLSSVARMAEQAGISCQVCLEEYMACGIGACKGCAVQLVSGMGTVCKDGPVFDAKEVVWDV